MSTGADVFHVVFICTGNRFRSVLAEHQLRLATDGLPVRVSSFGTFEQAGVPALADAVELGTAAGFDLSEHRSRTLRGEDLTAADLVVGFERNHLAAAVVDAGAPREKTFGANELAELLARVDPPAGLPLVERARAAVALAHVARGGSGQFHELADPFGRGRSVAAETARQVSDRITRITFGLFGALPVTATAEESRPGFVLFLWSPSGWTLQQRHGNPPAVGETIEAGETLLRVTKLGPSPLPGDSRVCAYTQAA